MKTRELQSLTVKELHKLANEQGIKDFSNWPTVPQLYVKGEFVGGADILREMFEDGELEGFFDKAGIVREINS